MEWVFFNLHPDPLLNVASHRSSQKNPNIRIFGYYPNSSLILVCLDLPDDGPEIHGGQPRYNIGDNVNVTCISRNSLPAAKLSWYINGEKADPIYLRSYPNEIIHKNLRSTGLETSRLGLTFKVIVYDLKK